MVNLRAVPGAHMAGSLKIPSFETHKKIWVC